MLLFCPKAVNYGRHREKLEQQKSYYDNQAKKNQRIADYSLDEDNKGIYQYRANQSQKKADELGKKLDETVVKSGGNGIIELNKAIDRKDKNIGAFSMLKISMQKRKVLELCNKYNIDTKGITFKIQRSESFLKLPLYGATDYNNIGRIDLFPNAFIDEEQFIKNSIARKMSLKTIKKIWQKIRSG